ncbi:MAG TPA: NAD(+)/NADH kinase [Actinomycetota bacterium]|nr:NAD(+)/NADH kinase [Actinomycetota bacterium]
MELRRAAMVVHQTKRGAAEAADELTRIFQDHGIEVTESSPDLVVSLGGDGTMLRAAQFAHKSDAPLLGINLGTMGYLTEVDREQKDHAVKRVIAGEFHIEERMMLACEVSTAGKQMSYVALNEVLVERESHRRLVRLHVQVGGESLAMFNADGIIVATPTGSTAYALSAGGPIVSPRAECIVIAPVNAHMMFARPVVLAADEVVDITVEEQDVQAALSLDGSIGGVLSPGAKIQVARHARPLRLIRLSGPGFLERLRAKMHLPGTR